MKIDIYTKLVLTLIALALWGLLLQNFVISREVNASTGVMDVNLKQIDGRNIDTVLDVNIEKISGKMIYDGSLPVQIKK